MKGLKPPPKIETGDLADSKTDMASAEEPDMRKQVTAKPKKPPTLPLGATDVRTGYLLFPNVAEKKGEYTCPECRHRVLLCRGDKVMAYFRHETSNEAKAECKHYSHPSESTIHRDAKEQLSQVLADILRKGTPLTIYRECDKCNKMEDVQEITMTPTTTIHQEYVFTFRGDKKRGDVVCMDDRTMRYVFEIWHSNRTQEGDRPEPWFDLYADRILMKVAEHENTKEPLRLPCNRKHLCKECDNEGRVGLRWMNLEMYVRIKLGQTYPAPGIDQYGRLAHARLVFDAQDNVSENREIIERFTADYEGFPVVVHSCKGTLLGYIILHDDRESGMLSKEPKNKRDDYWNYAIMDKLTDSFNSSDSSDIKCYVADLTGYTTVSAIMELIRRCSSGDLKCKVAKIKIDKKRELEEAARKEKERLEAMRLAETIAKKKQLEQQQEIHRAKMREQYRQEQILEREQYKKDSLIRQRLYLLHEIRAYDTIKAQRKKDQILKAQTENLQKVQEIIKKSEEAQIRQKQLGLARESIRIMAAEDIAVSWKSLTDEEKQIAIKRGNNCSICGRAMPKQGSTHITCIACKFSKKA